MNPAESAVPTDESSLPLPPVVPGALPVVGNALQVRRQGVLPLLAASRSQLGDVFRLSIGVRNVFVVASPEGAAHILQQNARNYGKSRTYQRMRLMLGNGLLSTEGEPWRRQRSVAQPFFHRQRISSLSEAMTKIADTSLGRWDAVVRRGEQVDVKEEFKRITLELLSHSVFGLDPSEAGLTLGNSTEVLSDFVERQRLRFLPLPFDVPTPRSMRARYHRWRVDQVADRVIRTEREGGDGTGLVAMLLGARDEQGARAFTHEEVRDQVITIMVAGHETTAAALGWTLFLLARHPDVAARVRAEVDAVVGQRLPSPEELQRLSYLGQVMNESMRIYPPAWIIGRRALQADTLGGYTIPAGSSVGVYPFLIHRHPDHWRRPDVFDPENFAPGADAMRPRFAFFPFGGGARLCIGDRLALLMMRTVLTLLVQRFDVSVPADYEPRIQPFITLGPPAHMPLRLQPRPR